MFFSEDQRTAVEAAPTKMCEKFDCLAAVLNAILSKLSNVELRQSKSSGEINDALRAFHQWACGQSSGIPMAAVEAVTKMILEGPSTYYKNFADKDDRRCEFELWKFYELLIKKNEFVASDSQHSTGECLKSMPSCLKLLHPEKTNEEINEMLEKQLQLLFKLKLPLNRQQAPMTIEKMVENQILPATFKSDAYLSEEAAKKVWHHLCELSPEFSIVEKIPINDHEQGESWHQQLIRKIVIFNQHKKSVHQARGTLSWWAPEPSKRVITEEEHKAAKKRHIEALDAFWTDKDPKGKLLIQRAETLKREWSESEKTENAKRSKKEEEAKGSEGEQ